MTVRYCSFSFFREDYAETDIVLFLIFRIGLIKSAVLSSGLSTGHLPIASEGTSYKMAMPVPFRISPCLSRPEIRRTSVSAYDLAVCSCMDIIYIRFSVTYFLYSFHSAWSFLFSLERALPEKFHFFIEKIIRKSKQGSGKAMNQITQSRDYQLIIRLFVNRIFIFSKF